MIQFIKESIEELIFKQILFLLLISTGVQAQDGKFSFKLSSKSHTSAGVYKKDSTLVRMLWSDSILNAGSHTRFWDGKDDDGVPLSNPDKEYVVKVLSNNVKYTWQGAHIGNTSDSATGVTKHRGYFNCMRGLAFSGSYGYFCTGYTEAGPSFAKFNIKTPNRKIIMTVSPATLTADINYVATDGIKVYWGAFDPNANKNSFVFATNVSDDAYSTFSKGISYTPVHRKALNVISYVKQPNSLITGLAVQKKGNYLFVSRAGLNQLQVLNKATGELVQTLKFATPTSISIDNADNIWMIADSTVSKYKINIDGTLSTAVSSLSGLTDPLAIQVSADGSLLAVAEGGASQQVKFFNTTTATATNTLGVAGGYFADATVSNNKFYFQDKRARLPNPSLISFIAYQPDGSFWVNDPGNFRVQHYDAGRKYINRIMSLGSSYYVWVDKNNIRRVWSGYMEFQVDYSIALSGSTGWQLVKNWGANVSPKYDKTAVSYITTLSNGRTYGLIRKGNDYEVVEFPATGTLRFTGVMWQGLNLTLTSDGSIEKFFGGPIGGGSMLNNYQLTGFDASGNPLWSDKPTLLYETPPLTKDDPNDVPRYNTVTSTGKVVNYSYKASIKQVGNKITVAKDGYHLGAIQKGSNKWLWKTEKATHINYSGDFPGAGYFDIGNGVNDFAGGTLCIQDRNIITTYHGEFWKNSQTNKFNHYLDNGLAIGQFGTTRPESGGYGSGGAAQMAGNALTATVVKDAASGNLYLYHGDESDHAAVHRWKITGLNTIKQTDIFIAYPTNYTRPVIDYIDLMAGLPFDDILANNTAGWTRDAPEVYVNRYNNNYSVKTSVLSYDKRTSPDLHIGFVSMEDKKNTVTRDLGIHNVKDSWKISGYLAHPGSMPGGKIAANINSNQYLDVLDNAGKVLARFYSVRNPGSNPYKVSIIGNKKVIAVGSENDLRSIMNAMLPFEVSVTKGVVTFKYGNYAPVTTTIFDEGGNWRTPALLRIQQSSVAYPYVYGKTIVLKDFRFYEK